MGLQIALMQVMNFIAKVCACFKRKNKCGSRKRVQTKLNFALKPF